MADGALYDEIEKILLAAHEDGAASVSGQISEITATAKGDPFVVTAQLVMAFTAPIISGMEQAILRIASEIDEVPRSRD